MGEISLYFLVASGEIALFFESEAPILEAQEHDGGVALSLNPPKSHLSHEKTILLSIILFV